MTWNQLIFKLEFEKKFAEQKLEAAKTLPLKSASYKALAIALSGKLVVEATYRIELIIDFLEETKMDYDSETGGIENFLFK